MQPNVPTGWPPVTSKLFCLGPGHAHATRQKVAYEHQGETVFPCGLIRAAYAKSAQRDHIKAIREEMTTMLVSENED